LWAAFVAAAFVAAAFVAAGFVAADFAAAAGNRQTREWIITVVVRQIELHCH
jgi:hypothetical protein